MEKSAVDSSKVSSYSKALKKNPNTVNFSQMKRLEKRALSCAEEARKASKEQQTIVEDAKVELLKAKQVAEKASHEAEEAQKEMSNKRLKKQNRKPKKLKRKWTY